MKPDPESLVAAMIAGDLDRLSPEAQRFAHFIWARAALDWGILLLIGRETQDGTERLICRLQEDGSCYVVETPADRSYADEPEYVAPLKAGLGGQAMGAEHKPPIGGRSN